MEREGIDTRYPDERNGQTITGLNELADYIEGLTAMDPSIAVIGGLWEAQVNDESIGAAFDHELMPFRFNDADASCDEFLQHLASVLMAEFIASGDLLSSEGVFARGSSSPF